MFYYIDQLGWFRFPFHLVLLNIWVGTVSVFLINVGIHLILFVVMLLKVAVSTWLERRAMGNIQRRAGPNVVGPQGLFQPIADGLKLLIKEPIIPAKANFLLFLVAPMLVLILSLGVWLFIPVTRHVYSNFTLSLLYVVVVGVLETYGILFAGWSSNSKYALLGGLRATAQMLSYEISLSFIFLGVIFWIGSFNLIDVVLYQTTHNTWLLFPLLPFAVIFSISMLAESNRAPFDLPEAEAEIVAGYNVEYSGFLFALFFLGEYAKMLFLSAIFTLLFGGGGSLLFWAASSLWGISFIFGLKVAFVFFFFVWVRASLPRYRYDQLMDLGWKTFLPFTFGFLVFIIFVLYVSGTFPPLSW